MGFLGWREFREDSFMWIGFYGKRIKLCGGVDRDWRSFVYFGVWFTWYFALVREG